MKQKQKSDTHFFNNFSVILGTLVAIAILLIVLARFVGAHTQLEQNQAEASHIKEVQVNVAPIGRVAIAGQDNAALAAAEQPATAPAANLPTTGEAAFGKICTTCHTPGLAGAPKVGDRAAWAPRMAQGKDTLYQHAINGYTGKSGVMPARGGTTWPDEVVRMSVDYMVSREQ